MKPIIYTHGGGQGYAVSYPYIQEPSTIPLRKAKRHPQKPINWSRMTRKRRQAYLARMCRFTGMRMKEVKAFLFPAGKGSTT